MFGCHPRSISMTNLAGNVFLLPFEPIHVNGPLSGPTASGRFAFRAAKRSAKLGRIIGSGCSGSESL